jgi:hypothetical protein
MKGTIVFFSCFFVVFAGVRKCGYPEMKCVCDLDFGAVFCGHDVSEFPFFPSDVKENTLEIRIQHSSINTLPNLNRKIWKHLEKVILMENGNINCHDVIHFKERNSDLKVISDCEIVTRITLSPEEGEIVSRITLSPSPEEGKETLSPEVKDGEEYFTLEEELSTKSLQHEVKEFTTMSINMTSNGSTTVTYELYQNVTIDKNVTTGSIFTDSKSGMYTFKKIIFTVCMTVLCLSVLSISIVIFVRRKKRLKKKMKARNVRSREMMPMDELWAHPSEQESMF